MKRKTIESFFNKADQHPSSQETSQVQDSPEQNEMPAQEPSQQPKIESITYERDPGKRPQIDEYPPNRRDQVRRFYISKGPFQPYMDEYPYAANANHRRRFQYHWFKKFPWLEFSPTSERAYCFPCFLFSTKPQGRCGSDTFTVKGFQNWKKVNNGKDCAFLTHMGQASTSAHSFAMLCYDNLKNSMGHPLQLALIAASREVLYYCRIEETLINHAIFWTNFFRIPKKLYLLSLFFQQVGDVHNFFQDAIFIINIISGYTEYKDELLAKQAEEISCEVDLGELDTRRANQIGAFQKPEDIKWSSHYKSIHSLEKMFGGTVSVLRTLARDRLLSYHSRGDAGGCLKKLLSFDFVFILHVMKEIMMITDLLCHTLQQNSLDALNAAHLVSTTKQLLQKLRDNGWEPLMEQVTSFCLEHEVELPNMNSMYVDLTKSRDKRDNTTMEDHYRVDIFTSAVDRQLEQLNARYSN
ncbi:zinc finger MYM-type-like protein [Rhynchospora pubera]|uniref:Zinc finger MYM-type-like protein n=1 Tax=Rhynchospora pubera TaxID=906938 RepID=A0AAV8HEY0_9POAL|nr:zinc finger MYM-type-like protein [Rhynchospora pubera]